MKLKCKGKTIHSEFRENYCGQKRVTNSFPCSACDFQVKLSEGVVTQK